MTTLGNVCFHSASAPVVKAGSQTSWVLRVLETVETWRERARQRRHLAALSDRSLNDIGIDRAQANFEARKPFWRQ